MAATKMEVAMTHYTRQWSAICAAGSAGVILTILTMLAVVTPAHAAATGGSPAGMQSVARAEESAALAPRCGWMPSANEPFRGDFVVGGARIRTGPSTLCTIKGLGYPGQGATYRCATISDDGWDWFYLTNVSTGVVGWVRRDPAPKRLPT
uniref:Uncharacterized protein n=1 Tax=uncultured bacterium esnapd14 TaxID=1366594 RepID=S5UCS4_9BACT|nr:hypothetical protein [uncultured bacterium esnapd14]